MEHAMRSFVASYAATGAMLAFAVYYVGEVLQRKPRISLVMYMVCVLIWPIFVTLACRRVDNS